MTLRLDPSDADVRALTRRALEASNTATPSLVVRCDRCRGKARGRAVLAECGHTSCGPLFTSHWRVPIDAHVVVNGARQNVRQYDARRRGKAPNHNDLEHDETHGVIALLALPPTLSQDFPDLLVRCARHGDAVLDRGVILDALRRSQHELAVEVALPHLDYVLDSSWITDDVRSEHL